MFILTDDLRWDLLGCYGNSDIKTPNLDRFAAEAARLDAFYVAAPVCCPSRAIFLSGLYPHQSGIYWNNDMPDFREGTETVATFMNRAGYRTGFIGKAHLGGNPYNWGFMNCPIFLPGVQTKHLNPTLFVQGKRKEVPGYVTEILADSAIRFLQTYKNERWFLWFATTAPHVPYLESPAFHYEPSQIKAPPGWPSEQSFPKYRNGKPFGNWPAYYSTISVLDKQIGRVLDELEKQNLTKNTFVFITSDNGAMLGSHGEFRKDTWYEEATRVPALVRWPGKIQQGKVIPFLQSSVDFLPTILELAGLPPNKKFEGRSFLPSIIRGTAVRENIFSEVKRGETTGSEIWRMVRSKDWKYVKVNSKEFLYNLKNDPQELMNVSSLSSSLPAMQIMRKTLDQWLQDTPMPPPPNISIVIRFFLRLFHVMSSFFWIGAVYFSAFLFKRISILEKDAFANVSVESIVQWQKWTATVSLLTGLGLFYAEYLYPNSTRFTNENGLTLKGIVVCIGMALGFVQWLGTLIFFAIASRNRKAISEKSYIQTIILSIRLNQLVSVPALLCMLASSHVIPNYLFKLILIFSLLVVGSIPFYLLRMRHQYASQIQ